MKLRWTTRTSLFARMSLLFGLLVTVPLIISGIVLSLVGRQGVVRSGNDVASLGQSAVDLASQRVKRVAGETLKKTAGKNVDVSANRLNTALQGAKTEARNALNASADQMQQRGTRAVEKATTQVVDQGRQA